VSIISFEVYITNSHSMSGVQV